MHGYSKCDYPCMAHNKLHVTCMFHAIRKHEGCIVVFHGHGYKYEHTCKNEVIIEWYHSLSNSLSISSLISAKLMSAFLLKVKQFSD